jgi:hypothetical protein
MDVIDFLRRQEASLFPPSSRRAMLLQTFQHNFNLKIPADYRQFLAGSDGAMWGGAVFYGCESHRDVETGVALASLEEANKEGGREHHPALVLGRVDDDLIIFDPAENLFGLANEVDLEMFETAATFGDLIKEIERQFGAQT